MRYIPDNPTKKVQDALARERQAAYEFAWFMHDRYGDRAEDKLRRLEDRVEAIRAAARARRKKWDMVELEKGIAEGKIIPLNRRGR